MTNSGGRSAEAGPPRQRFHGRRRARALRPLRRRLLDEVLPKLRFEPPDAGRIDPAALPGGGGRPLWLEIGFGGGEHLAWQAEHNPGVEFLGCDLFLNGIASLLRHVQDRRLENVRMAECEATALLQALPDGAVARAFVLFPDPWPKKRHHKRRLMRRDTFDQFARTLAPGAELRFATDHGGYARLTLALALAHRSFTWPAMRREDWRERPSDWPETRYEAAARQAGRRPVFFTFRRNDANER